VRNTVLVIPTEGFLYMFTVQHMNSYYTLCRDGLRDYITGRIRESMYPILCPNCMASTSVGASEAGSESQSIFSFKVAS
jgi:hypothetical protein